MCGLTECIDIGSICMNNKKKIFLHLMTVSETLVTDSPIMDGLQALFVCHAASPYTPISIDVDKNSGSNKSSTLVLYQLLFSLCYIQETGFLRQLITSLA